MRRPRRPLSTATAACVLALLVGVPSAAGSDAGPDGPAAAPEAPTGARVPGVGEAPDGVVTSPAQLPEDLLQQVLPESAAEAGLPYAPRLLEVSVPTQADRDRVLAAGLDVTEHAGDDHLEVVLTSQQEQDRLDALGLASTVVTDDLVAQERERILADAAYARVTAASALPSARTTYRNLDDYASDIDALVAAAPSIAKRISVGESVEGRDLVGVEIGEGVDQPEDGRPVLLLFGAHHAREWPSAELPMEFAIDLVAAHLAGEERTRDLLSRARVIVVPVSNPDGFDASRTSGDIIDLNTVDGGGTVAILGTPGNAYKRKNCRLVDGQTQPAGACVALPSPGGYGVGVDLNRNYGALWGGPGADSGTPLENGGTGSASPIYRGPAPFSEPETQAIRTLISTRQVTTLISNHTFGNLLLRPVGVNPATIGPDGLPLGFAPDECFTDGQGDDAGMQALGERMTAQTGYSNQFGWELYDTTGTTEDYSYNATGGYGYTFEIGPEQFHPPYAQVVAEYTGDTAAAGAVTGEGAPGLTTPTARDCPGAEVVHGDTAVGGGLREAYYLALENAADEATHAVLEGTAPEGAVIGVTRTGTFPLWDGTPFSDTVTTTMTAPGGRFDYHVNPSTRPFVASRPYTQGEPEAPQITPTRQETRTGSTPVPTTSSDVPIDVPEGTEALVVELTASALDDYDLQLFRPDATPVDTSGNGNGAVERVEATSPAGLQPGQWVARVTNFAAVTPWSMSITLGTVPDAPADQPLLFSPGTTEAWTVTCTVDDEVVATRQVEVDRGETRELGALCAAPGVTRLGGADRFATAARVAQELFPDADSAGAVVLARADEPQGFSDALAGGPLAVARSAPLLLTDPTRLVPATRAEIDRVLPAGGRVYVLGGTAALSPAVEQELTAAGYDVVRLSGRDRAETAVAIAEELGRPDLVLVATGTDFPDALAASAAAGAQGGAVLLSRGELADPATDAYLAAAAPTTVLAVGGPASRAYPDAEPVVGVDRVGTALELARSQFDAPVVAGLARTDRFPDALTGAAHVAALGGPVLLTPTADLDPRVSAYVCGQQGLDRLFLYGGTGALSALVEQAALLLVTGAACAP